MKKITAILFIACVAMLFTACHKEGVYNPSKKISKIYQSYESGPKYLQQIWTWNKDNTLGKIDYCTSNGGIYQTYNFTYEKKRLVRINDYAENSYVEYKYDNKGLKESNYYEEGVLTLTYTFTHKNGKIIKITETNYDSYFYKGDARLNMSPLRFVLPDEIVTNTVEAAKKARKNSKSGISTCTYDLTWEGNNIIKVVYTDLEDGYNAVREAQYDKKKNPFYASYKSFYFESDMVNQSRNNVTNLEYIDTYDGETNRGVAKYEYTYDGQWPLSQRCIQGSYTELTEFEYN